MSTRIVGFVLIGGIHQALHLLPAAVTLSNKNSVEVKIFVLTDEEKSYCQDLLEKLGGFQVSVTRVDAPAFMQLISRKLAYLVANRDIWKSLDAMIVAERTSTILKFIEPQLPTFIHIPHGAGDRAKSYDRRIKHFDHVIVAGEKDRRNMIARGLVSASNCSVSGYIKPFAIEKLSSSEPSLFDEKRPVILYNPHFDPVLSSWNKFGDQLLEIFKAQTEYNVVIAPHIRLSKSLPLEVKKELERIGNEHAHIRVDLESERLMDMTYTRAADIYVGDVSSQVYEFLGRPKPCIFLNSHEADWRGNSDYAHWNMGTVCNDISSFEKALENAFASLPEYATAQRSLCKDAKGLPSWNPMERAADKIFELLD